MANEEKSREAQIHAENKAAAEEGEANKTDEEREDETPVVPMLDNLPENKDYVGLLEYEVNPDPGEEAVKQQAENFPRVQKDAFRPEEHEVEEARVGRSSTARAVVGRVVVVEEDLLHDGEVYKAGVQDLPLDVADALIADGAAFEPAGKKRGR